MSTSRRAGGIARRCECRGPDGKLLGTACPQRAKKSHGALAIRQELPLDSDGKRRPFRRTGYASVKDAQADLDKLRAVLDLLGDDDEGDACRVGDLLQTVMRDRLAIPSAEEVKRRLGVGVPLDGTMTVGQWLDYWVAKKKTKRKTTGGYASHIRVHLKPALESIRLVRLGVAPVQAMFDAIDDANEVIIAENQARREQIARCKRGKPGAPKAAERAQLAAERARLAEMPPFRRVTGPATQQRIRATLRTALNAAISAQHITFNAASHVELAPGKRPKGMLWTDARVARWRETGEIPSPVMVWTPAQLGEFLDKAEGHRLYAIYHLIAHHGPRRGEAVGQARADVDYVVKKITVVKEIIVDGWTPVEETPKTDGSAASMSIDSGTVTVLKAQRVRQLAERDAWNAHAAQERAAGRVVADWVDTGKVFGNPDGTWLHPDTVSKTFVKLYTAAGLPPINLRDLRHGAAGLVKAAGGDLHDAKVKLRHSTIVLTSDTYMELFQEYEDELTERTAAVVPRARKAGTGRAVSTPL